MSTTHLELHQPPKSDPRRDVAEDDDEPLEEALSAFIVVFEYLGLPILVVLSVIVAIVLAS